MICPYDIVWRYVDILNWCKYIRVISHCVRNNIPSFKSSKSYTAMDTILQVSNVLLYPAVMVLNTIFMIRQALTKFAKPGKYVKSAIHTNWPGYRLSKVRSGIKCRKVIFCDEIEKRCLDTKRFFFFIWYNTYCTLDYLEVF